MSAPAEVVVVGAGQAGLAVSRELTRAGVRHCVLEKKKIAATWRGRWESFCLVTPNWSCRLPGYPYEGSDPDGFMPRDEIVSYLERYAVSFDAPVSEGVEVTGLRPNSHGGFVLDTSTGQVGARFVVLASGAYQRPYRPRAAATLPADLFQIDADNYRSPGDLPDGPVLVVGSGQTGCQIAEELHHGGREVFLACGRAPWVPRRLGEYDMFWWAIETGFLDQPVSLLAEPKARLEANVLATGHDGGHDLHLRTLRKLGVTLVGHFLGADGRNASFAQDLRQTVAWGDRRRRDFIERALKLVAERGMKDPEVRPPEPFGPEGPDHLNLRGFGAVIFAGGFRPEYESWVHCPGAFDPLGFPVHVDGKSTVASGLYFVGTHFLRKRKSSLLVGVGEDATIVARDIAQELESSGRGPNGFEYGPRARPAG